MRIVRQILFHLRQISTTSYFLQLMAMGTLSACIIQRLGAYAWGVDPYIGFVRSFTIGLWTSCTAAAGILGFERRKGTLVYLACSRSNPLGSLSAVVIASGTYGLLAFPLSAIIWLLPGRAALSITAIADHLGVLLVGVVSLWVSAVVASLVIASIFIITPNAIAYEGLLLVPLLFISGVFISADGLNAQWVSVTRWVIPSLNSVQIMYYPSFSSAVLLNFAASFCGCAVWLAVSWLIGRRVLRVARQDATLELV